VPKRRSVHDLPIVVPGLLRRSPDARLLRIDGLIPRFRGSDRASLSLLSRHVRSPDLDDRGSRRRLIEEYVINNTIRRSGWSNDGDVARRMRYRRRFVRLHRYLSHFRTLRWHESHSVLPGHWPSLSLSLLSAKWTFRNVISCAADARFCDSALSVTA